MRLVFILYPPSWMVFMLLAVRDQALLSAFSNQLSAFSQDDG
jgi:hypothetical protein